MSRSGNDGHIGITNGCLKGENFLSNAGYQSSRTYLALPDILRLSFRLGEQTLNVKQAPASEFHAFISEFVEAFEDVDTSIWPIHQRWRVINACLAGGIFALSEVADGYLLEVPEGESFLPELQPETAQEGA